MMNYSSLHDVGAYLKSEYGGFVSVTAGGGGDGSEVSGPWVDVGGAETAKVILGYTTTLAENATLSLAANLQDATDSSGTDSADYGSGVSSTVVATGGTGGTTETGSMELDFNLRSANGYIRNQFTPTMSASSADTASVMSVVVLGGGNELPVTQKSN